MPADWDRNAISDTNGGQSGAGDNVVYLDTAGNRAGGDRIASGAGDDTIGVSANVLAFGKSTSMGFLDYADAGLVLDRAGGAAVSGGLGSATLFGALGADSEFLAGGITGADQSNLGAGGAAEMFGFGGSDHAFADVLGAFKLAADRGPGADPSPVQAGSIGAGSTLYLPDGTTVTLVDLSKLIGPSLL